MCLFQSSVSCLALLLPFFGGSARAGLCPRPCLAAVAAAAAAAAFPAPFSSAASASRAEPLHLHADRLAGAAQSAHKELQWLYWRGRGLQHQSATVCSPGLWASVPSPPHGRSCSLLMLLLVVLFFLLCCCWLELQLLICWLMLAIAFIKVRGPPCSVLLSPEFLDMLCPGSAVSHALFLGPRECI